MNMAMKLAIESPYQRVDALVTLAVMAWFTTALALMLG
jgi:hypothetical protein